MQNLIDDVTRRLVSRLPETKAYYSLTDLNDFQIPSFIISRIELELRKNLADSIVPPATDWANMKSANVKSSWDHFLKAIHEQVRLPRSFSRSVIEVAVADVLDLLIEPRKNMVDMIFGTSTDLKFEDVRQAASYVTVYPYLPDSLIKYMHRKQLPSISKEKAQSIIALVDAKLTEKYSPLNWAQLIDPLFVLLGEEIESEAFRLFFLDKGKVRWAEFFDREKYDITRTRFIELLSTPELDGIEALNESNDGTANYLSRPSYGKPSVLVSQPEFEEKPNQTDESVSIGKVREWGLEESNEEEFVAQTSNSFLESESFVETSLPLVDEEAKEFEVEAPITTTSFLESEVYVNSSFTKEEKDAEETEVQTSTSSFLESESLVDEDEPIHEESTFEFVESEEKVSFFEKEMVKTENAEVLIEEPNRFESLKPELENEVLPESTQEIEAEHSWETEKEEPIHSSFTFELDVQEHQKDEASTSSGKSQTAETLLVDEHEDEDDLPIYKKMERQSNNTFSSKPKTEQVNAPTEELPFWKRFVSHTDDEKPLIDLEENQSIEDISEEILAHLKDLEHEFVNDIFGGDANAYIESIDELAALKHWDEVSNYIKKEIFRINQVDVYSDSGLDFIERLQTYFTSKG